jgi:hypothetical protein
VTLPPSSNASERVFILKLERSRALVLWWAGLHLLLGVTVLQLAAGVAPAASVPAARAVAAVGGLLTLALHAHYGFPHAPLSLILSPTGLWSVPERGLHALELAPGTSCSAWWVLLILGPPRTRVLVLRDQLGAESWRRLTLAIRECRNAVE